jgi:hypothetical protein
MALLWLLAVSSIFYLSALACGARRLAFGEMLALVAYAAGAASLLAVVPFSGPLLSTLAWIFLLAAALEGSGLLPRPRAFAAALLPYFVLGLALLAAAGGLAITAWKLFSGA